MTLFEECLIALGKNTIVLSEKETIAMFEHMTKNFPPTAYGRIDWSRVNSAHKILSKQELLRHVNSKDEVYILWDEASLPAVKTTLQVALDVIDDVTAVSFDTWIYNPKSGYVIEFYHENEMTLGLLDR